MCSLSGNKKIDWLRELSERQRNNGLMLMGLYDTYIKGAHKTAASVYTVHRLSTDKFVAAMAVSCVFQDMDSLGLLMT